MSKEMKDMSYVEMQEALYYMRKNGECTEEKLIEMIKIHPHIINDIDKDLGTPSKELQLAAVKQSVYSIMDIEYPCLEAQLLAIEMDETIAPYIKNACEQVVTVVEKIEKSREKSDFIRDVVRNRLGLDDDRHVEDNMFY